MMRISSNRRAHALSVFQFSNRLGLVKRTGTEWSDPETAAMRIMVTSNPRVREGDVWYEIGELWVVFEEDKTHILVMDSYFKNELPTRYGSLQEMAAAPYTRWEEVVERFNPRAHLEMVRSVFQQMLPRDCVVELLM
jgi:hypothetical protein